MEKSVTLNFWCSFYVKAAIKAAESTKRKNTTLCQIDNVICYWISLSTVSPYLTFLYFQARICQHQNKPDQVGRPCKSRGMTADTTVLDRKADLPCCGRQSCPVCSSRNTREFKEFIWIKRWGKLKLCCCSFAVSTPSQTNPPTATFPCRWTAEHCWFSKGQIIQFVCPTFSFYPFF